MSKDDVTPIKKQDKIVPLDKESIARAKLIDASLQKLTNDIAERAIAEVNALDVAEVHRTEKNKLIAQRTELLQLRASTYNNIATAHGVDLNEEGWFLESDPGHLIRRA